MCNICKVRQTGRLVLCLNVQRQELVSVQDKSPAVRKSLVWLTMNLFGDTQKSLVPWEKTIAHYKHARLKQMHYKFHRGYAQIYVKQCNKTKFTWRSLQTISRQEGQFEFQVVSPLKSSCISLYSTILRQISIHIWLQLFIEII